MQLGRRIAFRAALLLSATIAGSGCGSLTPRSFRSMSHPAPVVRAGAVGLGDDRPDSVAIPAWIARLDDKDPVVRMAANESLKSRTKRDFGFIAWDEPDQRASAVAKWKAWWAGKSRATTSAEAGLVNRRRNR